MLTLWNGEMLEMPEAPRSLRSQEERARRVAQLDRPHIRALSAYAARLREPGCGAVPEFDPLDGGVAARALFLLEKPGPMTDTDRRRGSGFVSRDNDDPTAEAIFRFMVAARLPRSQTLIWNLVPWWNGTINLTPEELRLGTMALPDLVGLLPDLRIVVLVGGRAAKAAGFVQGLGLPVVRSAHPSPIVRATRPQVWRAIPDQWSVVAGLLDGNEAREGR